MTISVADLGHNSNGSGATITASITVPAGAAIFVFIQEDSPSYASGTLADAINGAYTRIATDANNGIGGNGGSSLWYFLNSAALSSTTLTYTKGQSSGASWAYFYATGVNAIDPAVTAHTVGNSTTASVTSGTPAVAGELFIAANSSNLIGSTYTQDTANGWASPFDAEDGPFPLGLAIGGGNQVNAGTSAITFAPTVTAGTNGWVSYVAGFKPGTPGSVGASGGTGAATGVGTGLVAAIGHAAGVGNAFVITAQSVGSAAGVGAAHGTPASFGSAQGLGVASSGSTPIPVTGAGLLVGV